MNVTSYVNTEEDIVDVLRVPARLVDVPHSNIDPDHKFSYAGDVFAPDQWRGSLGDRDFHGKSWSLGGSERTRPLRSVARCFESIARLATELMVQTGSGIVLKRLSGRSDTVLLSDFARTASLSRRDSTRVSPGSIVPLRFPARLLIWKRYVQGKNDSDSGLPIELFSRPMDTFLLNLAVDRAAGS